MPLDYSKWDNIEDSSVSSDDCHPNIEKESWKRMKKRQRQENGTLKHLEIRDKWNTTSVTKTNADPDAMEIRESAIEWMKKNEEIILEFSQTETEQSAIQMLVKEPRIADHVVEGYLITKAIDDAVQIGEDTPLTPELLRLVERCLLVHNCVLACKSANLKPEISVKMFAARLEDKKAYEEYQRENAKQFEELKDRIYKRRKERILEKQLEKRHEDHAGQEEEDEKIPVGPGGLHPNDVMPTLPVAVADAFVSRDVAQLEKAMASLPLEESDFHMDRCIKAGLWVAQDDEANGKRLQRIAARLASGKKLPIEIEIEKRRVEKDQAQNGVAMDQD